MNTSISNSTGMERTLANNGRLVKIIVHSLLAFTGLLCNTVIVILFTKNKLLRRSSNTFILNMAISDLLVPLFSISILLHRQVIKSDDWQISGVPGLYMCKIVIFMSDLSPLVSTFCLLFMSFDRFLAIVYPTKRHLRTPRVRRYFVGISWLLPILYCLKSFYASKMVHQRYCAEYWGPPWKQHKLTITTLKIFYSVIFILLPLVLITVFYGCILWTLRKQHLLHKKSIFCQYQARLRRRQRKKINILAFSVVVAFILCYGPLYCLVYINLAFLKWTVPQGINQRLMFPAHALAFANATVNPVICFLFNSELRKIIKESLPCRIKICKSDYQCRLFGLRESYELKTIDAASTPATVMTSVTYINDNEERLVKIVEDHSNNGGYVIRFENLNERI